MRNATLDDPEAPRYLSGTLLLTFSSGTTTPALDDPRVLYLLQQAAEIAEGKESTSSPVQESLLEVWEHVIALFERAPELKERASDLRTRVDELQHSLPVRRQSLRELWLEALVQEKAAIRDGQGGQGGETQPPLTVGLPLKPSGQYTDAQFVRIAVNRINTQLGVLQKDGVVISSAMPNWIVSGSGGSGGLHGGPGTVPSPAPGGSWPFEIYDQGGRWIGEPDAVPDPPVIVAILDSWPGTDSLKAAAHRHEQNDLLQSLAAPGAVTVWDPPPGPVAPPRFTYADADHGVFVAGVIHSIAPHADLHLLPILDERGLGSTDRLLKALDHCLHLAQRGGARQRVVVNLSLYMLIPPDDAPLSLWDVWFKDDPQYHWRTPQQNAALLEYLDEEVERRIALLLDAGVVVVVAAGNDALSYGHLQPRLPADYDTVLCVVAADRTGHIARYSNRADVPLNGNCVATLGGQGIQEGPIAVVPQQPAPPPDPRDGVVSVYTQAQVAIGAGTGDRQNAGVPNGSGWVYWSGTSFATPIISAIAATILAANERERQGNAAVPRLTPRGVMARVLGLAEPASDPALGCPYVRVMQRWTPPSA